MMQRPQGRPLTLSTERFVVRSLTPADASDRWCNWSADPDVMGPLNVPANRMTKDQLARYIAGHDNDRLYLLGVFTKAMNQHIGFFMIELGKLHATAGFNLVIGDKHFWGKGVVNEVRAALLDEFFERRGVEKAYGTPLARNFPAVFNYKAQGWKLEGVMRGQCKSVVDGTRLDQYHFGMLRDEWRARKGATS
ncbi:MAG: GNAT family N-acetyltransferase [Alphaproteobacteria bacterium]|nr:GNAT family N-acetyltransferase [Alphaproteobacteria bacterium]